MLEGEAEGYRAESQTTREQGVTRGHKGLSLTVSPGSPEAQCEDLEGHLPSAMPPVDGAVLGGENVGFRLPPEGLGPYTVPSGSAWHFERVRA